MSALALILDLLILTPVVVGTLVVLVVTVYMQLIGISRSLVGVGILDGSTPLARHPNLCLSPIGVSTLSGR